MNPDENPQQPQQPVTNTNQPPAPTPQPQPREILPVQPSTVTPTPAVQPQPVQQPVAQTMNAQQFSNPKKGKGKMIAAIVAVSLIVIVVIVFVMLSRGAGVKSEVNDLQRKSYVGKFLAAIGTFSSNNIGYPPTFEQARDELIPDYILNNEKYTEFNDPVTGKQYVVVSGDPAIGELQYAEASICSGTDIVPGPNRREAAVRIRLQSGKYYCAN